MDVDIVRQLSPTMIGLLHGRELFVAEVTVDPRTGELLAARTRVDSLALSLTAPYANSTVPPAGTPEPAGSQLALSRELSLERVPEGMR